ncbi:unnamed protein product [Rotaria socialis]|uniref:Uncharacterized protein n=1 Tax=Rotaria socialis TaxID=392032 RepID=A0A818EWE1_9BILA|nr:unnamed protein product [Rotaria socialis]CAF4618533.1 unnamed protein product [Rotaria socialis]
MSTTIQHNQATCRILNPNQLPRIELLLFNEVQVSSFQSVPYHFISPDWWPKSVFEQIFPNGQIMGNVNFSFVRVAQVDGFLLGDYILSPNIDPRAWLPASKLFVLGSESSLPIVETKAIQQETEAECVLFFIRSNENCESLFGWLLELRGIITISGHQHEHLRKILIPQNIQRRVQFDMFQQLLGLPQ